MKVLKFLGFLSLAFILNPVNAKELQEFSFKHDGLERSYILFKPDNFNNNNIVFALHGGGGNMNMMAREYKIVEKAKKDGFAVVFPNGYSKLRNGSFATWNAGDCCGASRDENVDDVGFVIKIIDDLKNKDIPFSHLSAIGMSNGGMMAYRLACEKDTPFQVVVSATGTDATKECKNKNPISVMHYHAKDDEQVLFNGGRGTSRVSNFTKDKVFEFNSVDYTINKWVAHNQCSNKEEITFQNESTICKKRISCSNNVEVQYCISETGGHSWPGAKRKNNQNFDLNDVIFEFIKMN